MARKANRHWYGLYRTLKPLVDRYAGDESVYTFIRDQAKTTGYNEKVVKRMLKAGAFLDRLCGPGIDPESVKCGYAHIEILERIHGMAPEDSSYPIDEILANKVTLKTLSDKLRQASESGQAQLTARSRARHRIVDHLRLSFGLVQKAGPEFFGHPTNDDFIFVKHFTPLSSFILIQAPKASNTAFGEPEQADGRMLSAVIPRLGKSTGKIEKIAADLLNTALALRTYIDNVWVLLGDDDSLAGELSSQASVLEDSDQWFHIVLPSDDGALIKYRNLRNRLDMDIEGMGYTEWEGILLRDGSRVRGQTLTTEQRNKAKPKPKPKS